jgi:hypothetical protein
MPGNSTEPGDEWHGRGTRRRPLPQYEHNLLEYIVDEIGLAETAAEVAAHARGIARIEAGEGVLIL